MKCVYSSFALKQLQKYGWTEGSGIGKNEQGRSDPVKVTLKRDSTGLGFDIASKHTSGWWDDVFREALDKFDGDPTCPKKRRDEDQKAGEKKEKINSALYRRFSKGATLVGVTSLNEEKRTTEADEVEPLKKKKKKSKHLRDAGITEIEVADETKKRKKKKAKRLNENDETPPTEEENIETKRRKKRKKAKRSSDVHQAELEADSDEEAEETKKEKRRKKLDDNSIKSRPDLMDSAALFQLCEGRTAHPAARHGQRTSGKLARVARQDALLLQRMRNVCNGFGDT